MKEKDLIDKAEQMLQQNESGVLDNSDNEPEKEVRLTEVINENGAGKKVARNTRGSRPRKSYASSKTNSKHSSKIRKKGRGSGVRKLVKPKKSIMKRTSTINENRFIQKKSNPNKNSRNNEMPVLPDKNGQRGGQKISPGIDEEESSADDSEGEESEEKSLKTKNTRLSRGSKISRKSRTFETGTDISEMEGIKKKYPKLVKITHSSYYQVGYFISYYFLALNDHFRVLLLSKSQDTMFLVFTLIFLVVFMANITLNSFVEPGYLLRFFFFVDCISFVIIFASIFVTNVSIYVVLSFLKTIMIVRVTNIVVSYRKYSRKKLVERVLKRKRETEREEQRKTRLRKERNNKYLGPGRANDVITAKQMADGSVAGAPAKTEGSQRESQYFSIATNAAAGINEQLEQEFKKQTKLESHVTLLTIKRTMTCFFAIIFSVPFFISTTYKSFLTEFEPIAQMVVAERAATGGANYTSALQFLVEEHKGDYDGLVQLEAPGFNWESDKKRSGDIRNLNLISVTYHSITFTVDLTSTMKLYALVGIIGYLSSGVLLVAFVIYINSDLSKYVIFPLESMYEKVVILSRNPMAATNDEFATKAGIASLLQSSNSASKDEIHLIDRSIMKIAYLLAVGYGEAGTDIIISNMNQKTGMDIDIPGQKVIGIYGF